MKKLPKSIIKKLEKLPDFQRKVYSTCFDIPAGEVRTYAWIANKIGTPGAARAVGTALAKNPFAPIIPCHRVIRSDGGMGGYSGLGGIPAKIKMLYREGFPGIVKKS